MSGVGAGGEHGWGRGVRVRRERFANGATSRVFEIRASSLEPVRLSAPSWVRAREVAHIFAAKVDGPVVAVALPPQTLGAGLAPEPLRRFGPETYLTLRAALGRRFAENALVDLDGSLQYHLDPAAGVWLRPLVAKGLVAVASFPKPGGGITLTLPVGSLGFLRTAGGSLRGGALLNTHFFLLSASELDSPFAAVGDPFGLVAAHGTIRNPPTVRRAALVRTDAGWQVAQVGSEDLEIAFPDGTVVRGVDADRPADSSELWFRGRMPSGHATPVRDRAVDVCIQGDLASVVRVGGGLPIPQGALVVSFPDGAPSDLLAALARDPRVRMSIPSLPGLRAGLQVGPELVRGGQVVLDDDAFARESFRTLGTPNPVGPVVFPADTDRTSAARLGAGVLADGTLLILAVEGASSLTGPIGDQPAGCTLLELAELLRDAGAIDALNFDGGGSTQVFRGGGALLGSADARGVDGASFDRPVPVGAWVPLDT